MCAIVHQHIPLVSIKHLRSSNNSDDIIQINICESSNYRKWLSTKTVSESLPYRTRFKKSVCIVDANRTPIHSDNLFNRMWWVISAVCEGMLYTAVACSANSKHRMTWLVNYVARGRIKFVHCSEGQMSTTKLHLQCSDQVSFSEYIWPSLYIFMTATYYVQWNL
jgi:hypothetical protein